MPNPSLWDVKRFPGFRLTGKLRPHGALAFLGHVFDVVTGCLDRNGVIAYQPVPLANLGVLNLDAGRIILGTDPQRLPQAFGNAAQSFASVRRSSAPRVQ